MFRPLFSKFRLGLFLRHIVKVPYYHPPALKLKHLSSVAFLSWFLTGHPDTRTFANHFDTEKQISQMISQAQNCILNEKPTEAKTILQNALNLADDNQAYGSLSYLCDLLSSIVLDENELLEAENMIGKFIEKLLQLGYPETHNTIVKFKLKLARVCQLLGSQDMAEYGLRDCISVQEKKMENLKQLDEESNGIYLTALFWYGKLLADQKEFVRSRREYKKCLDRISKTSDVLPSQKMVVLHNIAAVSAILKDFDSALYYLSKAIEICLIEDPSNSDLPIYVVQKGLVYLQKEFYKEASFWCQTGHSLASHEGNKLAEVEGQKCIQELRKLKIVK